MCLGVVPRQRAAPAPSSTSTPSFVASTRRSTGLGPWQRGPREPVEAEVGALSRPWAAPQQQQEEQQQRPPLGTPPRSRSSRSRDLLAGGRCSEGEGSADGNNATNGESASTARLPLAQARPLALGDTSWRKASRRRRKTRAAAPTRAEASLHRRPRHGAARPRGDRLSPMPCGTRSSVSPRTSRRTRTPSTCRCRDVVRGRPRRSCAAAPALATTRRGEGAAAGT